MALDHQTDDSDAEADFENIWLRLLHMVIIAVLMHGDLMQMTMKLNNP